MVKLKGIALNENGSLKTSVRASATDYVAKILDSVPNLKRVSGKNCFYVEFADNKGNQFYSEITITTGVKSPYDKAGKSKAKTEPETVEWE